MTPPSNRRQFLETAGAGLAAGAGAGAGAGLSLPSPAIAQVEPSGGAGKARPRVAALASTYYYLSHAYHIVGRFLDGFMVHDGHGLHKPDFDVASLYIEQVGETDLGRAKAKRNGVRLSPTIADALTLGTGKLAV